MIIYSRKHNNVTLSIGGEDLEELISKRELLEKYGISYGALYRWKRMGLIPEDWFIRRSTPAGQETFFNRAMICERIDLIMGREDSSLSDLAAELGGARRGNITVRTAYGDKTFATDDVKQILLDNGKGNITVIFENKE